MDMNPLTTSKILDMLLFTFVTECQRRRHCMHDPTTPCWTCFRLIECPCLCACACVQTAKVNAPQCRLFSLPSLASFGTRLCTFGQRIVRDQSSLTSQFLYATIPSPPPLHTHTHAVGEILKVVASHVHVETYKLQHRSYSRVWWQSWSRHHGTGMQDIP
jgi:hypothetical protein